MSPRDRHGEQIDPFNAGEPDLPWSEPDPIDAREADGHDGECTLDNGSYNGPTKVRDDYNAPDSQAPQPQREGTGAGRRGPAKRQKGTEAQTAARPSGKDGRRHPFIKAALIFIIVVNALPFALALLGGTLDESGPEPSSPSSTESTSTPEDDRGFTETAEHACIAAAEARLSRLTAKGSPDQARVSVFLDRIFEQGMGYTASELGIDADAFAELVTSRFTFEVDSCYASDDGTANVYFNSWGPSAGMIANTASQKIFNYLFIENDRSNAATTELTEGQKDRIRALFTEAIDEQGTDNEGFSSIDLRLEGDSWVLDEDEAVETIDILLGIW